MHQIDTYNKFNGLISSRWFDNEYLEYTLLPCTNWTCRESVQTKSTNNAPRKELHLFAYYMQMNLLQLKRNAQHRCQKYHECTHLWPTIYDIHQVWSHGWLHILVLIYLQFAFPLNLLSTVPIYKAKLFAEAIYRNEQVLVLEGESCQTCAILLALSWSCFKGFASSVLKWICSFDLSPGMKQLTRAATWWWSRSLNVPNQLLV